MLYVEKEYRYDIRGLPKRVAPPTIGDERSVSTARQPRNRKERKETRFGRVSLVHECAEELHITIGKCQRRCHHRSSLQHAMANEALVTEPSVELEQRAEKAWN